MRDGTFRNGNYKRFVFLGKRTVKEGECMAIWLLDGRQKIIEGPRRKRLWCSNIRFLDRHQVDQNQFIVIYHRSGRREHIRGPYAMFENPVLHERVQIQPVVSVDGFESLVVYKEGEEGATSGGKVLRRIVRGPCQFMPDANEWVHEFSWSRPPSNSGVNNTNSNESNEYQNNAPPANAKYAARGDQQQGQSSNVNKFTKLKTIPDQLPVTITARTSDDVVLNVSVMLVHEIVDIERMLDSTGDPIGDFCNSISADILLFASKITYEKFLEVAAEALSNLANYSLLVQRSEAIGFNINKVIYRGYKARAEIQEMREARIRREAEMRFEDMQFQKKAERVKAELELEEARHEKALQHKEAEIKLEEQARERSNAQQLSFLAQLQNLSVDITKYLVSLQDKPDKVIKVEQVGDDSKKIPLLVNTK